jgi:ribosomal 50S subunit-recycling heat shock protein
LDVTLNRLCLTRSRSEAKDACDAGAVLVDGRVAAPSQEVREGQTITLRFVRRHLEVRVTRLPPGNVSKKSAKEMYEVVRDERIETL